MRLVAGCLLSAFLVTAATAQPAVTKFSPLEAFTVVYTATGLQTGTITQHSRKFGVEQSQINNVTFANGTRNQMQLITLGDKIVAYDPATKRAGAVPNPAFKRLVAAAEGKQGNDVPKALLQAINFVPTGRMQNIAGETCMVWENKQFSLTQCMTEDGIALESRQTVQGTTVVKTATSVRRGDAGPENAYTVPAGVQVQNVGSLNDLMGPGR